MYTIRDWFKIDFEGQALINLNEWVQARAQIYYTEENNPQ